MSEGGKSFAIQLGRELRNVGAKDLPLVPRAVLRAMADRADADGVLYPALDTIAHDAGTYPPTARRALDELDVLGWFEVLEVATRRRSAKYRLRLKPEPKAERTSSARSWRGTTAIPQTERSNLSDRRQQSLRQSAPICQTDDSNPSDRLEQSQKLTGSSQEASKEAHRVAHVPAHTREDRPTFAPTPGPAPLVLTSPDAAEKPKPKGRRKPALAVPEDPSGLSPVERLAFEAIAADPSLQPITVGVCQLVKDLCKNCPSVDVAREVRKAGMWMRSDPSRRKKNGAAFLANWVERAQNDAAKLPQTARPMVREELPLSTPRVPPNPRDIAKPESILRARAERNARIAAGEVLEDPQVECERVMKEVMQKLAPARVYA